MTSYLTSVRVLLLAAISGLFLLAPARADFIITGGSATVAPGGTGTVDFTITSTNPAGDALGSLNLELLISRTSGTSFLQFSTVQPDPYDDPTYVFSGSSFGEDFGVPFWGFPFSTVTGNDTITGGDSYDPSAGGTMITPSWSYLVARVQFRTDPHASAGDTFSIALVSDPLQTYFLAPDPLTYSYTSSDATIRIASSENPLPEPASVALAAIGGLSCLLRYRICRARR
jgi:hypothetical protein